MREQQLQSLLQEMTLEEKVAQLLQLAPAFFEGAGSEGQITGPLLGMGVSKEEIHAAGSVLGLGGAEEAIAIQEAHMRNHRLSIPLVTMADVIHGYRTIFPVPLAMGCSWSPELVEQSADIAAKEASVSGIHVTFSPMADLTRDPRWGRVMESTGEDPWLNSLYARAFVRGYQGGRDGDLSQDKHRLAACIKHFAAYGAAEGGRDYNTVDMSEWMRREYYMPAYRAALEEGCAMVMTAFNTVDGIPATGNRRLMRDMLREEWGFDGVLISDWGAVKEMIPHGVAADERECAYKAIQAGVDIEMMSPCYIRHLQELVENGEVAESLVDEAVLRILRLKNKLGLFEQPHRGADPEAERRIVFSDEHRQAAQQLASKSCVLLKNEGVLPLDKAHRVALIGPFAESQDVLGPWSCMGAKEEAIALVEGMKAIAASDAVVESVPCGVELVSEAEYERAIEVAHRAEVIVLALGESSEMSGEAGSRADIALPPGQLELLRKLKELGKPIVVVLFNGRPLDLRGVYEEADAILEAWYPGSNGGAAVAGLLYGLDNPSGKLVMSFPYGVGQVPVYYNCFNTGRPQNAPDAQVRYVSQYLDMPNEPLFPFGYGLSYSTFQYGQAALSDNRLSMDGELELVVSVMNTGTLPGEEIVQLYIRDVAGEAVRPLRELKGYRKVMLQPGETCHVQFKITEEMLRYHHPDLQFGSDPGQFLAFVGPNSRDVQELAFTLTP